MTRPDWHTSSYSNGATNCVEVREYARGADMRDSHDRERGWLSFPASEWSAFLRDLHEEQF
ncbi:DUF397 domain-containing protein [Halostreptopolyspora alba]|uniref:DUF397 domain-containing protein n=1 Tax=Halostreptopolyspora alba TaxID=2487137 RepID=A0A3N0EHX9_9ACTN|nr:DUF397 domain-containing protein [Nocardiopsaceae bacterium YIM 96095]